METKHTPTPFSLTLHLPDFDSSFRPSIHTTDGRYLTDREAILTDDEWRKIVRAVNAHEDLLKALRHAATVIAVNGCHCTDEKTCAEHRPIQEAIAKATGEK